MNEFGSQIEETQSVIIFKLKSRMTELERDIEQLKKDKAKLVGILVGAFFAFGDRKAMLLRIKKKHMMKANPAWTLFPEIDHRTKDLIVRFLEPIVKGGGTCQSTTTNAKGAENDSKCGTSESTTTQKSAQDVEPPPNESSTPNNT